MSVYQFVIDSDAPYIDPQYTGNDNYLIKTSDLEVLKNTQNVDTKYNPLTLISSFSKYHSMMQNNFYEPLEAQLTVELQQHLEKANTLNRLYDVKTYLGEQEEFLLRVNYLFRLLRIAPPVSFLNYLRTYYYNEDYSNNSIESDNRNIVNRWYRDILHSNYLMKKFIGTAKLYEYIFKSFYRYGSVVLRSKYTSEIGVFTPMTNKYFKLLDFFGSKELIDTSSLRKLIPNTSVSKWPYSVNIGGIKEINDLKSLDYFKYDTGKFYDEGIEFNEAGEQIFPPPPAELVIPKYDTGLALGEEGAGLVLDITADSVMIHENSLLSYECIMDNPWLDYVYSMAKKAKRASDVIMVGTQISLVASNTGRYISDPDIQELNGNLFTHPNIKAKFQLIKANYDINRNVSYVRLGTSSYDDLISNVFADHETDPNTCVIPVDVRVPAFEMKVGDYEVRQFNNYNNLSIMVHKNSFYKQDLLDQTLSIAQSNYDLEDEPPITTLIFPHKTLSVGTCIFEIEITFLLEGNIPTKRYILIKEVFNTSLKKYVPVLYYLNDKKEKLSDETINGLVDYNSDYELSSDGDYWPSLPDNLILALPYETINETTTYCKIDHINGELKIKLMIDPASKLHFISAYNGTGTIEPDTVVKCTYNTNSIRSLNTSTNNISSMIGITEIGIFNPEDDMIAYGSFPAVIYDTSRYHLTFNCLFELPEPEPEV